MSTESAAETVERGHGAACSCEQCTGSNRQEAESPAIEAEAAFAAFTMSTESAAETVERGHGAACSCEQCTGANRQETESPAQEAEAALNTTTLDEPPAAFREVLNRPAPDLPPPPEPSTSQEARSSSDSSRRQEQITPSQEARKVEKPQKTEQPVSTLETPQTQQVTEALQTETNSQKQASTEQSNTNEQQTTVAETSSRDSSYTAFASDVGGSGSSGSLETESSSSFVAKKRRGQEEEERAKASAKSEQRSQREQDVRRDRKALRSSERPGQQQTEVEESPAIDAALSSRRAERVDQKQQRDDAPTSDISARERKENSISESFTVSPLETVTQSRQESESFEQTAQLQPEESVAPIPEPEEMQTLGLRREEIVQRETESPSDGVVEQHKAESLFSKRQLGQLSAVEAPASRESKRPDQKNEAGASGAEALPSRSLGMSGGDEGGATKERSSLPEMRTLGLNYEALQPPRAVPPSQTDRLVERPIAEALSPKLLLGKRGEQEASTSSRKNNLNEMKRDAVSPNVEVATDEMTQDVDDIATPEKPTLFEEFITTLDADTSVVGVTSIDTNLYQQEPPFGQIETSPDSQGISSEPTSEALPDAQDLQGLLEQGDVLLAKAAATEARKTDTVGNQDALPLGAAEVVLPVEETQVVNSQQEEGMQDIASTDQIAMQPVEQASDAITDVDSVARQQTQELVVDATRPAVEVRTLDTQRSNTSQRENEATGPLLDTQRYLEQQQRIQEAETQLAQTEAALLTVITQRSEQRSPESQEQSSSESSGEEPEQNALQYIEVIYILWIEAEQDQALQGAFEQTLQNTLGEDPPQESIDLLQNYLEQREQRDTLTAQSAEIFSPQLDERRLSENQMLQLEALDTMADFLDIDGEQNTEQRKQLLLLLRGEQQLPGEVVEGNQQPDLFVQIEELLGTELTPEQREAIETFQQIDQDVQVLEQQQASEQARQELQTVAVELLDNLSSEQQQAVAAQIDQLALLYQQLAGGENVLETQQQIDTLLAQLDAEQVFTQEQLHQFNQLAQKAAEQQALYQQRVEERRLSELQLEQQEQLATMAEMLGLASEEGSEQLQQLLALLRGEQQGTENSLENAEEPDMVAQIEELLGNQLTPEQRQAIETFQQLDQEVRLGEQQQAYETARQELEDVTTELLGQFPPEQQQAVAAQIDQLALLYQQLAGGENADQIQGQIDALRAQMLDMYPETFTPDQLEQFTLAAQETAIQHELLQQRLDERRVEESELNRLEELSSVTEQLANLRAGINAEQMVQLAALELLLLGNDNDTVGEQHHDDGENWDSFAANFQEVLDSIDDPKQREQMTEYLLLATQRELLTLEGEQELLDQRQSEATEQLIDALSLDATQQESLSELLTQWHEQSSEGEYQLDPLMMQEQLGQLLVIDEEESPADVLVRRQALEEFFAAFVATTEEQQGLDARRVLLESRQEFLATQGEEAAEDLVNTDVVSDNLYAEQPVDRLGELTDQEVSIFQQHRDSLTEQQQVMREKQTTLLEQMTPDQETQGQLDSLVTLLEVLRASDENNASQDQSQAREAQGLLSSLSEKYDDATLQTYLDTTLELHESQQNRQEAELGLLALAFADVGEFLSDSYEHEQQTNTHLDQLRQLFSEQEGGVQSELLHTLLSQLQYLHADFALNMAGVAPASDRTWGMGLLQHWAAVDQYNDEEELSSMLWSLPETNDRFWNLLALVVSRLGLSDAFVQVLIDKLQRGSGHGWQVNPLLGRLLRDAGIIHRGAQVGVVSPQQFGISAQDDSQQAVATPVVDEEDEEGEGLFS